MIYDESMITKPGYARMKEFHGISPPKWGSGFNSLTGGVEHLQSFPIQTWISHPQQNVMEWNLQNWKGGPSPQIFIMFSICVQWPQLIMIYYDIAARKKSVFLNVVKLKHYESIFDPQSQAAGRTVNLCCRAAISPLMTLKSSVGPTVSSSWKLGMVGSPGFHGGWYLLIIII